MTSVTRLPSGAQLRELRLLYEKHGIDRGDLRGLLGLPELRTALAEPEKPAPLDLAEHAFETMAERFGKGKEA